MAANTVTNPAFDEECLASSTRHGIDTTSSLIGHLQLSLPKSIKVQGTYLCKQYPKLIILPTFMNLPTCPNHPDRKQQLTCLSDSCSQKFEPRCVQCMMTSKCRQSHIWKMISEVVQEIHEVCETAQSRRERLGKREVKTNPANQLHQKHIQLTLKELRCRVNDLKEIVLENIEKRANKLLSSLDNPEQGPSVVQQKLKACKKEKEPHILTTKLKSIGSHIKCSQDGTLGLAEQQYSKGIEDTDISMFENESNKLLENLFSLAEGNGNFECGPTEQAKGKHDKQIEKLLEQVKEVPILQSRIQALTEKLKAKEARIAKLESQTPPDNQEQISKIKKKAVEQIQKYKAKNVGRVKGLIGRRQQLYTAFQQYTQKTGQEELYIYNLKAGVNAVKLQVPVVNNVSYLFNEWSLAICDQLQFLGYSDTTGGEQTIEIPLISLKKEQPKVKAQDVNLALLSLLLGLR